MRQPAFSVLLKAFNEERLIAEAIASVLRQTMPDFELIVINDGSSDGTGDVVRGFLDDPRVRLIDQENRGVGASLNAGAAASSAPRIALIDADDLWFPEYLERMTEALDSTPGAGFAYTDAWWLQEATGRFFRQSISEYLGAPRRPLGDPEQMLLSVLEANWIFGLTAIERHALEAVGGFNSSLRYCEDYELWMRLLAAGYRAPRAQGRLVIQRERAGSMSRNFGPMLESLEAVYGIVAALDVPPRVASLAQERKATIQRYIEAEEGEGANRLSIWWATRSRLGRLRKRLAPRLVWHGGTPKAVREAFPGTDFSVPAKG